MSKTKKSGLAGISEKINKFLDKYILPWPVRYLTFRLVILMTIGLLIPLILFSNKTVLVLMVNSYLNVMSVAVSSIVLLYSTISEAHQKQIAHMQEERAREDHQHVTAMHTLVLQSVENQRAEIKELRELISQLTNHPIGDAQETKIQNLQALHPRGEHRFHKDELTDRWSSSYHNNSMVSSINKDFPSDME
jgi:hypothetical protein